ncbi:MAG: hypothetical protein JNK74_26105 [Candidatus Hydrogenedentes bacterium]|nr:hypothetical protein [Candidatus Hydrogenedentota bacterium]
MQFGKKTRNLAAASRRFFGERPTPGGPQSGPAVGTLEHSDEEENAMTPPPQEESMVAGDPTQRLLTALGRFQRQVSRAEEGAPQEAWCDECMNQLITGIEIALNEDWADVKEALTDVARILQTYEDEGRADQSIFFLKDSYEILCLMVGDLIVGNVRSGVMKKWQDRYERALDELADAGLTLVDDDSTGEHEAQPHRAAAPATAEMEVDHGFDAMLDQDLGGEVPGSVFDSGLAGGRTGRVFDSDPGDPFAPLESETLDSSPFEDTGLTQLPRETAASVPSLDELLGRPVSESDDLEDETETATMDLSDDFTADTDVPESPSYEPAAVEPAETLALELESEVESVPESLFAEPASASIELDFGGGSPEPEPAPEAVAPAAVAPVKAPPAPAPAPEAEPEPGTPEALFRTAQRAMAQGNLADAKVFALQLAANMAAMEADQVAGRIALIEADIAQNSQAIAAGEAAVGEAEHRVQQLEEQVALCQKEFEAKREQIGQLRDETAAVESSVEDLNRQIAELEARRNAELERLANFQQSLDDNLSEESRMQSELEALSEEESGSRENLDGARDHVLVLQQTGAAHASSLQAAQLELEQRRAAVADIENTIRQVGGGAAEPVVASGGESVEQDSAPAE